MSHATASERIVPWLVACALFMETLDSTIMSTALPQIALDLHTSPVTLKLALTSYLLSLAVFIPISGWMADRFGARRIFTIALVIFTAGSMACGFASSLETLVVARLVQGLGGAMMMPVARLILLRSFAKSELMRVTNFAVIPSLMGPAIGPLLGGFITTYACWRYVFFVNVPFGVAAIIIAQKAVGTMVAEAPRKLDVLGFVLFGVLLAGLSFGFEALGEDFLSPGAQACIWQANAVALVVYVWHRRRHDAPFPRFTPFRVATFRTTVAGSFLSRLGIGALPFLLPLFFQVGMQFSPLQSGALVMPVAVAMIAMKFMVKNILKWVGYRTTLTANTALLGLCIAQFACVTSGTPALVIIAMATIYGLVASLQFSCLNVLSFVDVAKNDLGDATSLAATVQQFSTSLGVGLSALLLLLLRGDMPLTGAVGVFHATLLCMGFLTFLSSLTFLFLDKTAGHASSGFVPHQARHKKSIAASR